MKKNCKILTFAFAGLFFSAALCGCDGEAESVDTTASIIVEETAETNTSLQESDGNGGPVIEAGDWEKDFDGLNGAAVLYDPTENRYQVYGGQLAETRRPPCSTFKIISSLIALENDLILPDDSVREWSGEVFWNEDWNKNIDFQEAFRTSCVWYFREVVDEIGPDRMKAELEKLEYGNCDISDWEGKMNANTDDPAMTGFWIESSLMISPMEQVDVMERIFGEHSTYSDETQDQLEEVMLISDPTDEALTVYGKTGMGADQETTLDAWFTGFADIYDERVYFCVYLGETDGLDISSQKAKEIALAILSEKASEVEDGI